jgi:hypothetical protein
MLVRYRRRLSSLAGIERIMGKNHEKNAERAAFPIRIVMTHVFGKQPFSPEADRCQAE